MNLASLVSPSSDHLDGALAREAAVAGAHPNIDARYVIFAVGIAPTPELAEAARTLLALARGRLDHAQALFDDALDRSLATDNTYNVILCLVAFAQLTLAEGDPERAALLAGAANSLRRRAGLQVFTSLTGEVQMVAQIRQALEADRFDQAFGAGLPAGPARGDGCRPRPP